MSNKGKIITGENRFIFVPQRHFNSSISRNLIRRRLNEVCRINQYLLKQGYDIAIFAKKESLLLSYAVLESEVLSAFSLLGLMYA